jgi:hypothetical protein
VSRSDALRDALEVWCSSADGSNTLRELRWSAPSDSTLASRIRNELPRTPATVRQVVEECHRLGVPTCSADGPCWGMDQPLWSHLVADLQTPCECDVDAPARALRCRVCLGCMWPSTCHSSPCTWCGQESSLVCPGCRCCVHFTGECRWRRGAASCYKPASQDAKWLCPDCCWEWLSTQLQPTSVTAAGDGSVALLMDCLAASCVEGAGVGTGMSSRPGLRGTRRWLLRLLRRHRSVWFDRDRIAAEAADKYDPAYIQLALQYLIKEGHAVRSAYGVQAVSTPR